MKVIAKLILCLAAVGGVISGCAKKSDIIDLQEQINSLKSGQIQTISGQISAINTSITNLKDTDTELRNYITKLESQATDRNLKLEEDINALKIKDEILQKQIDELTAYTTELGKTMNWVKETYTTLEKFNETAAIVADLQTKIDNISSGLAKEYDDAMKKAIGESEDSMKKWINEELTGYYDISTMNAKLDALKSEIEGEIENQNDTLQAQIKQNAANIKQLKTDLEAQAETIKASYLQAIEDACANNGVINKTIQDKIDTVNETTKGLTDRVESLEKTVEKLNKAIEEIQKNLDKIISRLQFISYIPEYSDGSARVTYSVNGYDVIPGSFNLRFEIKPDDIVKDIVNDWERMLSVKAVYTMTKASFGDFVDLKIKTAEADGNILKLTVSAEGLDDACFLTREPDYSLATSFSANVRLQISDGTSDAVSEYIRLEPYLQNLTEQPASGDYVDKNGTNFGQGVTIGNITWAPVNAGTKMSFYDGLCGGYYTYTEALTACPEGWRTPTKGEVESLIMNRTYGNNILANVPHYSGDWFSGDKTYSSESPAIFIFRGGIGDPETGYIATQGTMTCIWTSTLNEKSWPYMLNGGPYSLEVGAYEGKENYSANVRCVRD